MVVSGFEMPAAFVQLCEAIQRGEAPSAWDLKEDVRAGGLPWPGPDLRFLCDPEQMQFWTEQFREQFLDEDLHQDTSGIEDFTGVENFVQFADATDGTLYLFDFGREPKEPSVVVLNEGSWDTAAPNLESFMALFVPERLDPAPRVLLRAWALTSVLDTREEKRFLFHLLPGVYANVNPEERNQVEAEVREELERQGMTAEQRRRLDELWERLRVTEKARK